MLPLTLADEIRATILDYLSTTFNFQDATVERALLDFLEQPQGGLFKGPYVRLRLPFKKAGGSFDSGPRTTRASTASAALRAQDDNAREDGIPLVIRPPFVPYVHQVRAFERLTAQDGHIPQPTLITTGTGSGKTECFLYPILDYCYAHRGEGGVKAIILYPMNALATDQAGRLARQIQSDPRLRGEVTAGIYIGGDGSGARHMGPDHLIEDRVALRENPPDILLTNYKMLDFLLLRPEDKPLWRRNGPETLRFLVLDELHTYDGAQGSDVACLIRRLQARLGTPAGTLCPVGASATVISETGDTAQALAAFATEVTGIPFDTTAVVGEERASLVEFLPRAATRLELPTDVAALAEVRGERYADFLGRQMRLWFGAELDPFALSDRLREHAFLHALLACARDDILPWAELLERLAKWDPDFAAQHAKSGSLLLGSFLALISHARTAIGIEPAGGPTPAEASTPERDFGGSTPQPFLTVQVQLWVREMSRLMRAVEASPRFFWRDDVPLNSAVHGLPAYFCRECGQAGWLAIQHEGDSALTDDSRLIYKAYFDHHKSVRYIYPGARADELPGTGTRLCPGCLGLGTNVRCDACAYACATIPVIVQAEQSAAAAGQPPRDLQRCPACGTDGALSIVGSQGASLSSVAISHLFTSPLNTDKKLLAFTDSVQDAAHRAAFFGARTYRFSLRTAFQATLPPDAPIPLSDLAERTLAYWGAQWEGTPHKGQKLAATFMPPDLGSLPEYRHYIDTPNGPLPEDLRRSLMARLSWEAVVEYGFSARLGRSLEKAGSSVAGPDPALLAAAVERLCLILPAEIGLLRDVPPDAIRHFVIGLLERTRTRGGVDHPLLHRFVTEGGNWYHLTKRQEPLLSPFHKRSRFPKFLTDAAVRDVFDAFITGSKRATWYTDWARRTLTVDLGTPDINEVYRLTVEALADGALLRRYRNPKATAYGLEPSALLVTRQTAGVRCPVCGHHQTVAAGAQADWIGRPCLSFQCAGRYAPDDDFGQHYYRAIYERGHVERIFPHEHTGLLDRNVREDVETQFKKQDRADAANLLTATPTLELGIDIGDLSATMACSVPPATANYLQRIGRAGRKTGNSLILSLANARPHDLYFFEEPLEMIAGAITPPGCFLNAAAMLERQFLAFCLGAWAAASSTVRTLPHDVKLMLAGLRRGGFPDDFLAEYMARRSTWIEAFIAQFGDAFSPETQAHLRGYAAGVELPTRIRRALSDVEAERTELRNTHKEYRGRLDAVQADPAQYQDPQEQIRLLEQEARLILELIKNLEDQYVLNFFTDAGLLPNYAFPETGVELRAIVTGMERQHEKDKGYQVRDYLRPASLAIRELAPFNTFYAEGRKLPVTHIEVPGPGRSVERWQFCDVCSHMELVQASHYSTSCPACGSTMWHDAGRQHDMVRFRQAISWSDHYRSLAGDDADEREQQAYQMGRFFEIRPENSGGAHLLASLPFGFEYLNQVTLREINFGPMPVMGQRIQVASQEYALSGFRVCRGCGLVVGGPADEDDPRLPKHRTNCRYATSEPAWLDTYLYRDLTSEALRILLPVSTVLTDEKLATFGACLDLGLRRKFRGDPEYLQILPHSEPAADGTRRYYLVIYDTVPGGTSFLRDLAKPDAFREVLELALGVLRSCRCRLDPQKRACYRCLYSYRGQHDLELITRETGVEMLGEILSQWPRLEPVLSLSEAHIDSLIESELEQRFVNALADHAKKTPGCSWTPTLYNGKLTWELKLTGARWLIEPQVELGPAQGVAVPTRADFVLWPQGAQPAVHPIAVYTDGYAYHACPHASQGRIGDDVRKRAAILRSGAFVVWTATWDDVKEFEEHAPHSAGFLTAAQLLALGGLLQARKSPLNSGLARQNAVEQLLAYLRDPGPAAWAELSLSLALATLSPPRPPVAPALLAAKTAALRDDAAAPSLDIPAGAPPGDSLYGIIQKGALHLMTTASVAALQSKDAAQAVALTIRLEDGAAWRAEEGFRSGWRQFWLLANLVQFLPGFTPVSSEGIAFYGPAAPIVGAAPAATAEPALDPAWADALRYADPACGPLLEACRVAGAPAPIVGYELADTVDRIIAAAELAWETAQIAVFLPDTEADRAAFLGAGWRPFEHEDIAGVLAALTS